MPELAEVEYFRRQWDSGFGSRVLGVALHFEKRVFRGTEVAALEEALTGAELLGSESHGKQMLFRFSRGGWLGIHLGMSGRLHVAVAGILPGKHDHLVLFQEERSLVYSDPRMFGRVRFANGKGVPEWWRNLPPAVISPSFTGALLREQLHLRRRSPVKAVLLDQTLFPGVGNWMADEITWQVKVHPAARTGDLSDSQQHDLWRASRAICRTALKTIGVDWSEPPKNWLIHCRWQKGGLCPRDGTLLHHGTIAGRTTAWCPVCQKPSRHPVRNSNTARESAHPDTIIFSKRHKKGTRIRHGTLARLASDAELQRDLGKITEAEPMDNHRKMDHGNMGSTRMPNGG